MNTQTKPPPAPQKTVNVLELAFEKGMKESESFNYTAHATKWLAALVVEATSKPVEFADKGASVPSWTVFGDALSYSFFPGIVNKMPALLKAKGWDGFHVYESGTCLTLARK